MVSSFPVTPHSRATSPIENWWRTLVDSWPPTRNWGSPAVTRISGQSSVCCLLSVELDSVFPRLNNRLKKPSSDSLFWAAAGPASTTEAAAIEIGRSNERVSRFTIGIPCVSGQFFVAVFEPGKVQRNTDALFGRLIDDKGRGLAGR